jgi:hypothetical protein
VNVNVKAMEKWLDSDEGKAMLAEQLRQLEAEEQLAAELEAKSTLTYQDGQKVVRGDVFIDKYHEQLQDHPFGVTSYVYRINEDDTLDICASSCFAWKANNYKFEPSRSRLVRRNGKLQNPLFDPIIQVE